MDVSVVVVNFNTREKLRDCLTTIQKNSGGLAVETIVVDNGSSDGSADMVRRDFPQAVLIANPENRYFTGANNQGAAQAKGRNLLILNSDTQVLEDSLTVMSRFLDEHSDAGAVTCRMFYPDGQVYNNAAKDFTFGRALLNCTFLGWIFRSLKERRNREFVYEGESWERSREVDMVGDCNMMLRRSVWNEVGPYDERMKLYYTENDLCLRVREKGYKIYFVAGGKVIHQLRGTVSQNSIRKISEIYQSDTLVYFRKYHGAFAAAALRALIGVTNVLYSLLHSRGENIFTSFLKRKAEN